jgi:hypothetical protein
MNPRRVLVYYSWSRPGEIAAPLPVIEDRFPALFESRRMSFPRFHEFADPHRFEQGIGGFLDYIMKRNFSAFVDLSEKLTGQATWQIERVADNGTRTLLDASLLREVDTVIVISFDSLRTSQLAEKSEVEAMQAFLSQRDHLAFICPHHDIGDSDAPDREPLQCQIEEFLHHGDRTLPPRQRFGGFARSLLAGLGVPVENRYGLRPALDADGSPASIEVETTHDRLGILNDVRHFNAHPHLPNLVRVGDAIDKLDVLVRQKIDPRAPAHPFMRERKTFDALLQSRAEVFEGSLFVSDATLWSSTAGGIDSLNHLWTNVVQRPSGT